MKELNKIKNFYKFVIWHENININDFVKQTSISLNSVKENIQWLFNTPDMKWTWENVEQLCDLLSVRLLKHENELLSNFKEYKGTHKKVPLVSIMGHIDHGKTTLIDALMSSNVTAHEAGGITQNISISKIKNKHGDFFLIDTPGHAIFSSTRDLITNLSDIIIVVISAEDGIKEQTIEILKNTEHKNKIICITKIDRVSSRDFSKIYNEIMKYGVIIDKYSGETLTCTISAKNKIGIEELMENIALLNDSLDLKSCNVSPGIGQVLDSRIDKGFGYITKIILKSGKIQLKDNFINSNEEGRIKQIFINGKSVKEATVNDVIEIVGIDKMPETGSDFIIVNEEKLRDILLTQMRKINKEDRVKNENGVNFILKANNINQMIALKNSLNLKGNVIVSEVGDINEKNIEFTKITNSIIVNFGKLKQNQMKALENADVKYVSSDIIYHILEKIDEMLSPAEEIKYKELGKAHVRKVFQIKNNNIAGCRVMDGEIKLGNLCRIIRNSEVLAITKIISMKREKDDITLAKNNTECGIIVGNKKITFLPDDEIIAIEKIND
jgi:translation initiation factor IF-2